MQRAAGSGGEAELGEAAVLRWVQVEHVLVSATPVSGKKGRQGRRGVGGADVAGP